MTESIAALAAMPLEDLRSHEEEVHRLILERQAAERQTVIDEIVRQARVYEIKASDIAAAMGEVAENLAVSDAAARRKGAVIPAKYRNPENPSQTWAGRGKLPNWIRDSGKPREHFLIPLADPEEGETLTSAVTVEEDGPAEYPIA